MAELADAPDLGSGVSRRAGSSPVIRIKILEKVEAGLEPVQRPVIRINEDTIVRNI